MNENPINIKNPIDGLDMIWYDNSFTKNNFPGPEFHKEDKIKTLKYILGKNKNIIDTGAHIGDYGLCLAKALQNMDREDLIVFCIEPCIEKCKFMNYIVEINNINNAKIINTGLYDKPGKFSVTSMKDAKWNIKNSKDNTGAWQWVPDESGIDFTTLDILFDKKEIFNVGFIWLDTQWSEYQILSGGINLLRSCKPYIFMEYCPVIKYSKDELSVVKYTKGTCDKLKKDKKFMVFFKENNIVINNKQISKKGDILLKVL